MISSFCSYFSSLQGQSPFCCLSINICSPITAREGDKTSSPAKKTCILVTVEWPSRTKDNVLHKGLESLGKKLYHETYKQIAGAVWRNQILKKHVQQLFFAEVNHECTALCSLKNTSCVGLEILLLKNVRSKILKHHGGSTSNLFTSCYTHNCACAHYNGFSRRLRHKTSRTSCLRSQKGSSVLFIQGVHQQTRMKSTLV